MKAVLVGAIHNDKLYYVIDAGPGDNDAVVERPNGKIVKGNFAAIVSKASGLKKFRTTRFHRLLWDKPLNPTNSAWYKTFVTKERDIPEKSLEEATIVSALGTSKAKIKAKDARAGLFLSGIDTKELVEKQCCGQMVKSDGIVYTFDTRQQRDEAWVAMQIMRELEG